jgi:hypothetical protein
MRHITYTDTEFDYFRTVLKTPRRSIAGKVIAKKQRILEFPTKKVGLNELCLIVDKEDKEAKLVQESLVKYGFDKDDIFIEKMGWVLGVLKKHFKHLGVETLLKLKMNLVGSPNMISILLYKKQ